MEQTRSIRGTPQDDKAPISAVIRTGKPDYSIITPSTSKTHIRPLYFRTHPSDHQGPITNPTAAHNCLALRSSRSPLCPPQTFLPKHRSTNSTMRMNLSSSSQSAAPLPSAINWQRGTPTEGTSPLSGV